MRTFLLALLLCLIILPESCLAEPIIKSDNRTFDITKGIYDLQGHVFVQFPVKDVPITITGDTTKVYVYQQEIHGAGNIKLAFDDINFTCDKVDVYPKEKLAYLKGNLFFNDKKLTITSTAGKYCWQNKLATFEGNIKVNGKPQGNFLQYNIATHSII